MPTTIIPQEPVTKPPAQTEREICSTCRIGCDCRMDAPTAGCGHYACWGPAATGTCPDAPKMLAARGSKLFPALRSGDTIARIGGAA